MHSAAVSAILLHPSMSVLICPACNRGQNFWKTLSLASHIASLTRAPTYHIWSCPSRSAHTSVLHQHLSRCFCIPSSRQRRRCGFGGVLEYQCAWVGRGRGDVELHAQLGVELVVERPLRGDVAVAQLARHGRLQRAPELHLHLRAHRQRGQQRGGISAWVQRQQPCGTGTASPSWRDRCVPAARPLGSGGNERRQAVCFQV